MTAILSSGPTRLLHPLELRDGMLLAVSSVALSMLLAVVGEIPAAVPVARFLGIGGPGEAYTVLALSLGAVLLRRGHGATPAFGIANMRVVLLAAYLRALLGSVVAAQDGGCVRGSASASWACRVLRVL